MSEALRNTRLGVVLERRLGETFEDAAKRVAVDTMYAGRQRGLDATRIAHEITEALVTFMTIEGYYHA